MPEPSEQHPDKENIISEVLFEQMQFVLVHKYMEHPVDMSTMQDQKYAYQVFYINSTL